MLYQSISETPCPIVELQQVRKVYDTKVAVDSLSFTIEPGTMFGLLGPNGSGKTSSIRMMIGITVPDSGAVRLFDKPFDRESLKRVGYLPEERGLYKKMKVIDQLIFLGELHGLSATVASKRAHAWCERMQITEAIPKKTEELSKGMQRRFNSSPPCCTSLNSSSWTNPSPASIPSTPHC